MGNHCAPAPLQPELRALEIMRAVPPGCVVMLVSDHAHDPHLRAGEWAIVDPRDRALIFDELFAVRQRSGPCIWQIRKASRFPCDHAAVVGAELVTLHPTNPRRVRTAADLQDRRRPILVSDGPIDVRALHDRLLGRVIGVWSPGPAGFGLLQPAEIDLPAAVRR